MFSRYTLAFRDNVLHAPHNQHWFCPGNNPSTIAAKVMSYCSSVDGVIEGDYSNFDGRVSEWCQRHVMNAVYHRWFNKDFRKELKSYTDALIVTPARAKSFGFKYDPGVGVKSGSPTTCDLNTVLNAFLMYCAIRRTNPILTPETAFMMIGLAFGDDSLFERQYMKEWCKVVKALGMELKCEVCKPETGVTFLARVFPDPVYTSTSFQDPLRTWRKLHLTARNPNVPVEEAARDRLEGYLTIDKFTPVTSNYCRMVIRTLGDESLEMTARRMNRLDYWKEKPYWLSTGGSWPQREEDQELMLTCISHRTGFSEESLRDTIARLDNCNDRWSGPQLFEDVETPYKDTVTHDGTEVLSGVDRVLSLKQVENERKINHQRAVGGSRSMVPNEDRESATADIQQNERLRRNKGRRQRLASLQCGTREDANKIQQCPGGNVGKAQNQQDPGFQKTRSAHRTQPKQHPDGRRTPNRAPRKDREVETKPEGRDCSTPQGARN